MTNPNRFDIILLFRGNICGNAAMAQLVEHILGKDEVPSSNLGSSSKNKATLFRGSLYFWSCYSVPNRVARASRKARPVRIPAPTQAQLERSRCVGIQTLAVWIWDCANKATLFRGSLYFRSSVPTRLVAREPHRSPPHAPLYIIYCRKRTRKTSSFSFLFALYSSILTNE